MEIKLKKISVRNLTDGYEDNDENGVVGFGGKLDIRPPYQREFIYNVKQRNSVINTVMLGFPLSLMYWSVRDDGCFEIIDGQQRTISICQFVNGDFSFKSKYFSNLTSQEKEKILEYEVMVYMCTGTDREKLSWFETINIAGAKLTSQELRNATYHGTWTSDAKRHFSKNNCAAYNLAEKYMSGTAIRQDYLETAIQWISNNNVIDYMAKNQHEPNANELWLYFQSVINWVKALFPKYRKEMKGVAWGALYNEYKDVKFDPKKLEDEVSELMIDEDVGNKKGIYPYVITRKESYLNIRSFNDGVKRCVYELQKGICPMCKKKFTIDEMEADHITPWSKGGKTVKDNCQMLCKEDNRSKGGK